MHVTKKDQKFTVKGVKGVYTVKSFYPSSTGIEYSTLEEAKKNNPDNSTIQVKNSEYEGICPVEQTEVID